MKNTFYFMLKALFGIEVFTFLSLLFVYVEKWFDKKTKVNFKIFDVIDWRANKHDTHITINQLQFTITITTNHN